MDGMAWLTTGQQVEHILQGCTNKGWSVDLWWRDLERLGAYWTRQGWPLDAQAGMAPVPAGSGVTAWLVVHTPGLWAVWAIAAAQPGDAWQAMGPIDGSVTLFNAREHGAAPKAGPLVSGQRVATISKASKYCHFGVVAAVLPTGGAATVIMAPNGQPVDAAGMKWFGIHNRDAAFDFYWAQGRTAWKHYMSMRGALYNKQKGLTKETPIKGVKESVVPGLPLRTPLALQAANAIAGGAPVSLADKAGVLWQVHEAAMAAEKAYHATYLAAEEHEAEYATVMAHQAQLEAASASTWDAWNEVNEAWTREILS